MNSMKSWSVYLPNGDAVVVFGEIECRDGKYYFKKGNEVVAVFNEDKVCGVSKDDRRLSWGNTRKEMKVDMNDTKKIIFMPYIPTYWVEKEMREALNRWWNRKDESCFRKALNYLRMKKKRKNPQKRKRSKSCTTETA